MKDLCDKKNLMASKLTNQQKSEMDKLKKTTGPEATLSIKLG